MGIFGLGAALPVVALAYASRAAMQKVRGPLLQAGKVGKKLLGTVMLVLAALIVSGAYRQVETWLVERSPDWLTNLSTRF